MAASGCVLRFSSSSRGLSLCGMCPLRKSLRSQNWGSCISLGGADEGMGPESAFPLLSGKARQML
jgi:hypothetical protein